MTCLFFIFVCFLCVSINHQDTISHFLLTHIYSKLSIVSPGLQWIIDSAIEQVNQIRGFESTNTIGRNSSRTDNSIHIHLANCPKEWYSCHCTKHYSSSSYGQNIYLYSEYVGFLVNEPRADCVRLCAIVNWLHQPRPIHIHCIRCAKSPTIRVCLDCACVGEASRPINYIESELPAPKPPS